MKRNTTPAPFAYSKIERGLGLVIAVVFMLAAAGFAGFYLFGSPDPDDAFVYWVLAGVSLLISLTPILLWLQEKDDLAAWERGDITEEDLIPPLASLLSKKR